jgi:hypothetical protein
MDIPGCDRLNSDANMLRYSAALKMASSAAHINGKDKVMIEASNMFDDTENSKKVRTDFYTLVTDLTEDAFISTNKDYLNSKGIKFSGHYYGEETFDKHPFLYGDLLNAYTSCSLESASPI